MREIRKEGKKGSARRKQQEEGRNKGRRQEEGGIEGERRKGAKMSKIISSAWSPSLIECEN